MKKNFLITLILTFVCSILAKYISTIGFFKLIGHLVLAMLLGMGLQLFKMHKEEYKSSLAYISNKFLRLGIILLGFKLNIAILKASGIKSILLAAFAITFTIVVVYNIAKLFKVDEKLALLCACGCGICGAAAVMGVSPSVNADKDDTILSVAVVCILGTVFTLIIVSLKPFFNLTDIQYGVLSGASLHEIAHAVAAGASGGEASLDIALVTKLSRVLLLAPVAIIVGLISNKKNNTKELRVPLPLFMLGFILTSIIGTYYQPIQIYVTKLVDIAYILLAMAMAALGLNVNFSVIKQRGKNIFISAFIGSTLLLIAIFICVKLFF
ncbi:putative sulfate exporter family transporter [Sneathia sanguinegens]|uniref:Sulfate exporter family transporter n=1 Tax=Sneathia sanguinegens TaxID=40543 RepID=A0ABT7HK12_9FUSO|nr:putative sulfate exporter family transporter [Sneathia sanguinegens]MDK9580479.1 putative sulfate exporter family transporter [Sneathia sanguinegens]